MGEGGGPTYDLVGGSQTRRAASKPPIAKWLIAIKHLQLDASSHWLPVQPASTLAWQPMTGNQKATATVLLRYQFKLGKKKAAAYMFHEFQYSTRFLASHICLKLKLPWLPMGC